jgi:urease subunit gamma/beta
VDLTPAERDRLTVFLTAGLARATLARGLRLNAPEATALVCDELHMAARSGSSFDEVVEAGRAAVPPDRVLDGVAAIVPEIRVEVLLDEGSRLIVLRQPFGPGGAAGDGAPGAVRFGEGDVTLVPERERRRLTVTNRSARPIRVSSHYPFWRVNPSLELDRAAARGYRLDLPAGDSIRWEPGQTREVDLVAYGGAGGHEAGLTASSGVEGEDA